MMRPDATECASAGCGGTHCRDASPQTVLLAKKSIIKKQNTPTIFSSNGKLPIPGIPSSSTTFDD